MKILVTGGTVFVSRYTAKYFAERGNEVYVLNRGSKPQEKGVNLIQADRHSLDGELKSHGFDVVLDITAYNENDVKDLTEQLGDFGTYIFLSSSAVYPEAAPQPFKESQLTGKNKIWGDYGANKIAAEKYLIKNIPNVYIIRPPYLYGEMNNLYREAFVFDCAEQGREFCLPGEGEMPLQFFDVEDLCRFMELVAANHPKEHIFNAGNPQSISIRDWVKACYEILGKSPIFKPVNKAIPQRSYFPFYDYSYTLDVTKQSRLMPDIKPMKKALEQSYNWYKSHREQVVKKPLLKFIDENM